MNNSNKLNQIFNDDFRNNFFNQDNLNNLSKNDQKSIWHQDGNNTGDEKYFTISNDQNNSIKNDNQNNLNTINKSSVKISFSNLIIKNENMMVNLEWKQRDLIINYLNKFTSILIGKCLSKSEKENFKTNVSILMNKITNLKLIKQQEKHQDTLLILEDKISEIYLKLDYDLRFKIFNHLIKNLDLTILNDGGVNDEIKFRLIEENKQMINCLLNLEVDYIGVVEDNDQNFIVLNNSNKHIENALINLNTGLDHIKEKINEYSNDIVIYEGVNLNSTTKFEFELEEITKFLNTTNIFKNGSMFCCRNIPFRAQFRICNKIKNGKLVKYLQIFIKSGCDLKDKVIHFSSMKIKLCSTHKWLCYRFFTAMNVKFSSKNNTWGHNEFIEIGDLIRSAIKNDKLKFSIKLVIDKIEKIK